MKTGWLLREGEVLASAQMTTSLAERSRGLFGRESYEGAMLLTHTRSVHTMGMRFALDVAFLDAELVVLEIVHLRRWRITLPRRRGRSVLEAPGGSFERWGLRPGDRVEFRETQ